MMKELQCSAPSGPGGRRCGAGLGESLVSLSLVGVFERWETRKEVRGPRDVRRCPKCRWYNLLEPVHESDLTAIGQATYR